MHAKLLSTPVILSGAKDLTHEVLVTLVTGDVGHVGARSLTPFGMT
jgi:hypothetical protein